ncbi:MAG: secondary thiamine-phosphate synthase enzyme YjbQ [Endomicrobium sp.]|jgi:secondary thiamine-phosphate synthase enzyme|nr:secondary thiamine-phosphate synthase enzyme YjbQ [Endomicrobium sp.]
MLKKLQITTKNRNEFVNITSLVRDVVEESGVKFGAAIVFCPHTTAGITINENADPDVCIDIIKGLKNISPDDKTYRHCEGNSDAHIKSTLTGASQTFIIENAKILLGVWQAIYFAEFDGPRSREIFVKIMQSQPA